MGLSTEERAGILNRIAQALPSAALPMALHQQLQNDIVLLAQELEVPVVEPEAEPKPNRATRRAR